VDPGNEAEITLDTYPGRVIKAHVDSIIWAQAQGQLEASGDLPRTTLATPPGRFPVKLVVADPDKQVFLAAGARGSAAIYTEHLTLVHIIRKVLLRVASYLDYIIIKHSISLGH
jgi:multidrug resistance efflux pump